MEAIVGTAADIELKMSILQGPLADGDKDASLDHLSEIKDMLGELSEELKIQEKVAS